MLNNIPIINLIQKKLSYIEQRQNIIANNIANVNTPKAKVKDLKPFLQNTKKLSMSQTNSSHLSNHSHYTAATYHPKSNVQKLDGNNISLEEESMKLNHNNIEHQKGISLYNKITSMFNIASRNGK